eukprot:CAMPEP_0197022016 /NCGR_PEP_ID=MMETSP1384-20130603/2922_1 /TAXON_ID=29189 /ORGANISM="Ammonia sp." /LENGTH=730 /DNA_ID=CAMNT_0042449977 /DNA_START=19 /DNA_END=2211 /DNA_ORIENTATION=+
MNDREARKKALEAAKQRLELRKKQKQQLQALRQQKQSGQSTGFESSNTDAARKNDYGKRLVEGAKELISEWSTNKEQEEKQLQQEAKQQEAQQNEQQTRQSVPGPRADLNIVHSVNAVDLMKGAHMEYVKEIQTDSVEIGQHCGIITEQTENEQLNEILATFMENEVNPWPDRTEQVYKRIKVQAPEKMNGDAGNDDEKAQGQDAASGGAGDATDNDKENEQKTEALLLSDGEAIKLISSSLFLKAFRSKSQFLERALGINEEHSVFIEAHSAVRDIQESAQMEKLIKMDEIAFSITNGRPITCLDFDTKFRNRFVASYAGSVLPSMIRSAEDDDSKKEEKTDSGEDGGDANAGSNPMINIQSDGLINIFEFDRETQKYVLVRGLECQSMINCVQFHPSKENMIIGASVSGQVLGWDMSSNKKTPSIRTEFSSSCHTQPIFALKFLPSMMGGFVSSTKMQQLLTLSNDGKLCVWRDDMLYQPNNEFLLKLSKTNTSMSGANTSSSATANQAKEITTTCFSYPKSFSDNNNKLWLGSDEGCIYETALNLDKNDEKELLITSYIANAHYGPVTNVTFHFCASQENKERKYPIQSGLYLTCSFDWTVKLWHISSKKYLALFNQMEDYVYDVQWSPTNPSIFAVVDGSGNLTLFDLNVSFERPVSEPTNILAADNKKQEISITKLLWSPNGKQIIVGDSNGRLTIFECPAYDPTDADFDKFEEIIKRKLESNDR